MSETPCLFGRVSGPCPACSDWRRLFEDVARCKLQSGAMIGTRPDGSPRCSGLDFRAQYFEPNPETLRHWQDTHDLYHPDIDRRVMFVCESPKKQPLRSLAAGHPCQPKHSDFEFTLTPDEATISGYRAWDRRNTNAYKFLATRTTTSQADRDRTADAAAAAFRFGYPDERFVGLFSEFRHSVITNIVKCSEEDGGKPADVVMLCSMAHLRREIELFAPVAIVVLGPTFTDPWFERFAAASGFGRDRIVINHYTDRGNTDKTLRSWTSKRASIQERLASVPPDEVWWHDWYTKRSEKSAGHESRYDSPSIRRWSLASFWPTVPVLWRIFATSARSSSLSLPDDSSAIIR